VIVIVIVIVHLPLLQGTFDLRPSYENTMSHGSIFIGHDKATFGEDGTGWVDYDPDYECGGPPGTPGRACPPSLQEDDSPDDPHRLLHLHFPSYRDRWCPITLHNLFTKAQFPERIRVRIVQQNEPMIDEDCLEAYCFMYDGEECLYQDQIQIHKVHAKDAHGPTWARALLSQDIADAAYDGQVHAQDFCMATDSHMDFESEWDRKMIHMWNQAANEYGVLSTYVAGLEQLGKDATDAEHEVPHLCMVKFTQNVRTHATKCAKQLSKPKLTNAIWGAGLSFSKCHAELKVPVDPHTPGIFDGEEFNRAARFFTYGYDIYTPNHVYVVHNYNKGDYAPAGGTTSWSHNTDYKQVQASHERLYTMLDVPGGISDPEKALEMKRSRFGLGDRRNLDQLIEFSGIDLRHKKSNDGKNRCGNLQWVPFEEHPKGVDYIPRFNDHEQPLDTPDETSVWFGLVSEEEEEKEEEEKEGEGDDILKHQMFLRNAKVVDGFTNHKNIDHPTEPLPMLVQMTAFLLVLVWTFVIVYTRGTGKHYKKKK